MIKVPDFLMIMIIFCKALHTEISTGSELFGSWQHW